MCASSNTCTNLLVVCVYVCVCVRSFVWVHACLCACMYVSYYGCDRCVCVCVCVCVMVPWSNSRDGRHCLSQINQTILAQLFARILHSILAHSKYSSCNLNHPPHPIPALPPQTSHRLMGHTNRFIHATLSIDTGTFLQSIIQL